MRCRHIGRLLFVPAFFLLWWTPGRAASTNPFSDLHWRSIGPAVAGGRIAAVAGSDKEPFLYYLGGAGGVFKSANGGSSWDAVFTDEAVASVGAIAISPTDPSD